MTTRATTYLSQSGKTRYKIDDNGVAFLLADSASVLESGTCVGPSFALVAIIQFYIREFFLTGKYRKCFIPIYVLMDLIGHFIIKRFDKRLIFKENSFKMASSVYALVEKTA